MNKLAFFFIVAVAAVFLGVAVKPAGALQPQNSYPYAEVCLKNLTDVPIYYSFRWGTAGQWDAREIAPGGSHWHTYKYAAGSRESPNLFVKFDTSLGNGGNVREYVLQRYAVKEQVCELGKGYDFVRGGNGIDLKSDE
ncbi:MAG: hypothetical protein P4L43_07495 [Syntrophobacteraceae bacterium]|nr:hypothetical protein [Syntrophobacteraceae bacterium]